MTDWMERARKILAQKPKTPALGVVVNGKVVPVKKTVIPKKPT